MKRSRILSEIHEIATAMHRSGSIDEQTLREFHALALPRVGNLPAKWIRELRTRKRSPGRGSNS